MLRFLFSFKGRINRAKFWAFYLASSLCFGAAIFVQIALESAMSPASPFGLFDLERTHTPGEWASGLAIAATYLCIAYLIIATVAKRLHDRSKSAWWLAFFYGVPIASFGGLLLAGYSPTFSPLTKAIYLGLMIANMATVWWYLIEILFLPGTKGDNRFGPDPRGRKISELPGI